MNKDTKNIIIVTAVTLGIGTLFYLLFRRKESEPETNYIMENKTVELGNNLIVSLPVTKLESYPLIYVFGGIDYANPKWMLSKTPMDILARAIVAFIPYTTSFNDAKGNVMKYLQKNNIKTNSSSIIGFSAGGLNVQRAYNNDFKFVGLIDPSTRNEFLTLPFGKNTFMAYNDSNWGGYPTIKSVLPKLDSKIQTSGGQAERVQLKHSDIPKYFFDKFKNEII